MICCYGAFKTDGVSGRTCISLPHVACDISCDIYLVPAHAVFISMDIVMLTHQCLNFEKFITAQVVSKGKESYTSLLCITYGTCSSAFMIIFIPQDLDHHCFKTYLSPLCSLMHVLHNVPLS